jgi:predicted TIM-barrel fold metal-dependent hydrolase
MGFIDCDTHVIECEETWDYMDPSERRYRPVVVDVPGASGEGTPPVEFYLIGETFCRRFPTDCRPLGFGKEYTAAESHLTDPAVRLRTMDALGVDVQIVISTNFIAAELANPLAEAAVTRSWNRWIADRTADTGGRLRWLLVPPLRTMDRAIEEMEFGKAHGAAGVMLKGVEHGMFLHDPYLFPLYEKAQDLDLTMVVHTGAARHHIEGTGIGSSVQTPAQQMHYLSTVMQGLYAVLASDLNERFPQLRFVYVESGAAWVPAVFQHYQRTLASLNPDAYVSDHGDISLAVTPLDAAAAMEEHNLYVACESDEQLPFLTSYLGEGSLVIGTDMCHNDRGSDPVAHSIVMSRTDIDTSVARRITDENARRAFNIPSDFAPSA